MGNIHKNLLKIASVVPEISSQTDRQTHTDMLITVLRNRSRWRSNKKIIRRVGFTYRNELMFAVADVKC